MKIAAKADLLKLDFIGELVADDKAKTAKSQAHIRWLIGGLAAVVMFMALAIWQLARRKQTVSLVPMPMAGGAIEQWQQRARK